MDKKIETLYKKASMQLDGQQIGQALTTIRELLALSGLTRLVADADRIGETYRYMTRYMLDGIADAGRNGVLSDMTAELRTLADKAIRQARSIESPEYYYSTYRLNRMLSERVSQILGEIGNITSELTLAEAVGNDTTEMRRYREETMERLFNTLFTSLGENSDYSDLERYLTSGYADKSVAALSVSAVTLGLLYFYDKGKFNLLLDLYEKSDDQTIRARALTGIVVAMIPNARRIKEDLALMGRLSLWHDSLETYTLLQEVMRVLIGTRDTERVTNKLKNEVIPELMKLRPEIMKTLKENPDLEAAMLEDNPEWAEKLSKSGLDKKMRELSEMQTEGADVMMVTFSNLKQFPFFRKASNWFLPFDANHTELHLTREMRTLIDMLADTGAMSCDSDLYSLALAAERMPKAQMDMLSSQMGAGLEQLREQQKADARITSAPDFNKGVLHTVRDLYRFFKLFSKRDGFFDPFAKPLQFTELPVIGDLLSDNDVLRLFGEFYFKRGYYADALPLFRGVTDEGMEDATLWEKIGFCHQSAGQFAEALEAYNKAALLKTPGPWLVNKLAYVNRRLGRYAEAAELYTQALEMDPENFNLIMNAGNMLLESGDTGGALSHYYHANYLWPDNAKVQRAVAWGELLNGNFSKSADYYNRIISAGARASDYLNAGHAAMMEGNLRNALNYYRLACADKPSDFKLAYEADMPVLKKIGADEVTLNLMLDLTLSPG